MLILAVVIVACAYYLLVFAPSRSAIDSSQSQVSQLESELAQCAEQLRNLKSDF